MTDIIENSTNPQWKVQYSEIISRNDPLTRNLVYHNTCMLAQWQKVKHTSSSLKGAQITSDNNSTSEESSKSIEYISAEIEFFADIQQKIDEGQFIPMDQVEKDYSLKMTEHNILDMNKKTVKGKAGCQGCHVFTSAPEKQTCSSTFSDCSECCS